MSDYSLVAFQFKNLGTAQEFMHAANRLQKRGHVALHDAVYVTSDLETGTAAIELVDVTTKDAAKNGALWGGLLGLLLTIPVLGIAIGAGAGAIAAKATDTGITDAFIESMRAAVTPGHTVLVLLASQVNESSVRKELERYAGIELVSSNLSEQGRDLVRAAIKTGN